MKELRECIKRVRKRLERDRLIDGIELDLEAFRDDETLLSFCEKVLENEEMPKKKEVSKVLGGEDPIIYIEGYNQARNDMLIWHTKEMKKREVDVGRILDFYKSSESPYGINWCNKENRPRDPNSIGCCDYCGGEVRLKTLAQAIADAIGGTSRA